MAELYALRKIFMICCNCFVKYRILYSGFNTILFTDTKQGCPCLDNLLLSSGRFPARADYSNFVTESGTMKNTFTRFIALLLVVQFFLSPLLTVAAFAQQPYSSSSSYLYSTPSRGYQNYNQQQQVMPGYGMPQDTYFTDSMGNILMYVNVLGEVYKPGQHIVRQDSDISSVLSLVGGPSEDANLKKAKLLRHKPDEDGKQTYPINLESYFEEGDRSGFVELKPNDTLVIPEDKGLDTNMALRIAALIVSAASVYAIATR